MLSLEESDWRILLKSIQQGRCVLLLGPNIAIAPGDQDSDPLSIRLARQLAAELRSSSKGDALLSTDDLAHVAQTYKREMRQHRAGLELATEDFYSRYRDQTTQVHRDLAALPFTLCINTTPERFLLNAFKQVSGKKPIYDFYHFQPDPKRRQRLPVAPSMTNPERQPLVYDLYGSIEQTDSLVLTENDLLDFLVSVLRQAPPIHPFVSGQFNDPAVSFLFLGFGFSHWYVRILLHAMKASGHEGPSLALEDATFFTAPEHQETTLFFQSGHAIEFRLYPTDFAGELRRRFEEQMERTQRLETLTAQLPASAPTAFLCHESRDKIEAEKLAEDLQERGVRIWLDKQNLRGGDDWVKQIPGVVERLIDYFVVLQSPRMIDKPESYFNLEIHCALNRQLKFRDNLSFIIPILLEAHPQLPLQSLAHLNYVDMTQPRAIDALARAIHEDWQKRQA